MRDLSLNWDWDCWSGRTDYWGQRWVHCRPLLHSVCWSCEEGGTKEGHGGSGVGGREGRMEEYEWGDGWGARPLDGGHRGAYSTRALLACRTQHQWQCQGGGEAHLQTSTAVLTLEGGTVPGGRVYGS